MAVAAAETSPAPEAAWETEAQRPRAEVLSGKAQWVPGDEVERSLDRLLG